MGLHIYHMLAMWLWAFLLAPGYFAEDWTVAWENHNCPTLAIFLLVVAIGIADLGIGFDEPSIWKLPLSGAYEHYKLFVRIYKFLVSPQLRRFVQVSAAITSHWVAMLWEYVLCPALLMFWQLVRALFLRDGSQIDLSLVLPRRPSFLSTRKRWPERPASVMPGGFPLSAEGSFQHSDACAAVVVESPETTSDSLPSVGVSHLPSTLPARSVGSILASTRVPEVPRAKKTVRFGGETSAPRMEFNPRRGQNPLVRSRLSIDLDPLRPRPRPVPGPQKYVRDQWGRPLLAIHAITVPPSKSYAGGLLCPPPELHEPLPDWLFRDRSRTPALMQQEAAAKAEQARLAQLQQQQMFFQQQQAQQQQQQQQQAFIQQQAFEQEALRQQALLLQQQQAQIVAPPPAPVALYTPSWLLKHSTDMQLKFREANMVDKFPQWFPRLSVVDRERFYKMHSSGTDYSALAKIAEHAYNTKFYAPDGTLCLLQAEPPKKKEEPPKQLPPVNPPRSSTGKCMPKSSGGSNNPPRNTGGVIGFTMM